MLVMAATGGHCPRSQRLSPLSRKAQYPRTLQPTTMSLNFMALPFEELNLCCKILKQIHKYTQKCNLDLVKYFAFVVF